MSIFLPWVAVAKALGELSHLEYWMGKQANLTSAVLSDLLEDEETIKKATLQNHAAINFFLLAHGHGCKEFEGLCCFNLTTHGESIQKKIKAIEGAVQDLKREQQTEWSDNPFKNWGQLGWAGTILNGFMWVIIITLVSLITLVVVMRVFQKFLKHTFIVNKEGGVVKGSEKMSMELAALPWRASNK